MQAKDVMKQAGVPFHVVELDLKRDDPSGSDIQSALAQKTGTQTLACMDESLLLRIQTDAQCACDAFVLIGRRTVPNVFLNKETIGGGSDVEALFQSGKLTEMLRAAGVLQ